jgi:hypothetical protein
MFWKRRRYGIPSRWCKKEVEEVAQHQVFMLHYPDNTVFPAATKIPGVWWVLQRGLGEHAPKKERFCDLMFEGA